MVAGDMTDPRSSSTVLPDLPATDSAAVLTTAPDPVIALAALTPFDRCDAPDCSSQAYVRARLLSGLDLVFCAHHGRELAPGLAGQGAAIRDDSHLLVEARPSL